MDGDRSGGYSITSSWLTSLLDKDRGRVRSLLKQAASVVVWGSDISGASKRG